MPWPRPRRPRGGLHATMPSTAEQLVPWLAAATVAAGCQLAVALLGFPLSLSQQAVVTLSLAGTLAATGLLAARTNRELEETEREERARPALDELTGLPAVEPLGPDDSPVFFSGMQAWTDALIDLFDRAVEETKDPAIAEELAEAAEDTRALRELLRSSTSRGLSLNEAAMLHTVVTLWETDQERLEAVAASVDPTWHRRWRARTLIARRLRHGVPTTDSLVLPYRA